MLTVLFSLWQNSAAHMFSLPQVVRCVPVSLCKSSSRAERSRNPAISKKSYFPPSSSAASAKIYPATKGSHKASPLIRGQPWHDCISSFQSCAKIPCLLYQYSSLWQPHKHRDTIFLPALCEQMNKVQGHSQFLMLSYLVPKFLSSEIRSLCSEVSRWQPLYFFPLFHPFWIILLLC